MPYAFTEQGIAMLCDVLKSDIIVDVSIKIRDTLVRMRNFFILNRDMFAQLDRVWLKQLETDKKTDIKINTIILVEYRKSYEYILLWSSIFCKYLSSLFL